MRCMWEMAARPRAQAHRVHPAASYIPGVQCLFNLRESLQACLDPHATHVEDGRSSLPACPLLVHTIKLGLAKSASAGTEEPRLSKALMLLAAYCRQERTKQKSHGRKRAQLKADKGHMQVVVSDAASRLVAELKRQERHH